MEKIKSSNINYCGSFKFSFELTIIGSMSSSVGESKN